MQVQEPYGQRFKLSLERLREGDSFSFEGVSFWLARDGHQSALNSLRHRDRKVSTVATGV